MKIDSKHGNSIQFQQTFKKICENLRTITLGLIQ
jgi:hypothetical protein